MEAIRSIPVVGHDAAVVIFALLGLAAFAVLALLGLRRRTLWAVLATVVVMGAVVFALSVWPKPVSYTHLRAHET